MKTILRLAIATIAAIAFAHVCTVAVAQTIKQIKLSDKHVEGFIAAQKDMGAITEKLEGTAADTAVCVNVRSKPEAVASFPKSSGVVFMEIDADEDRTVVEPFLEDQKWDKEVYYEDGLARLLNVMNIPSTILFDKSGKLSSRMDGFDPSTFLDQMTTRIQSMLSAK